MRDLSVDEMHIVAGGDQLVSYRDRDGSLVTERWSDDGSRFISLHADYGGGRAFDWTWGALGAAGGVAMGFEAAEYTSVGVGLAAEYGIVGAELGAVAGPAGVAVGLAVGALMGYTIYEYGPDVAHDFFETMGVDDRGVQTMPSPI
jgi:hypothetical protein